MRNEPLATAIADSLTTYIGHYGVESAMSDVSSLLGRIGLKLVSTSSVNSPPIISLPPTSPEPESGAVTTEVNVTPIEWTPSQEIAIGKIRSWLDGIRYYKSNPDNLPSRFFLLRGYAGTGKSFLMKHVLDAYSVGLNMLFSAPTHQAARILSAYIGSAATTVASRLGVKAVYNEDQVEFQLPDRLPYIPAKSVLVVDEASMLNKDYVRFLVQLADQLDIFLLFVGDPLQLPPVGETRSSVWSLVKEDAYRHTLVDVRRNTQPDLLAFLTDLRSQITDKTYENNFASFLCQGSMELASSDRAFLKRIKRHAEEFEAGQAKVVAWRNKIVDFYSEAVREILGLKGYVDVNDRLRLSGSFIPFENAMKGEVGVATEEVIVHRVETSALKPTFSGAPWEAREIPILVAELEGQTFDRHSVAIPDPAHQGPEILSSLLSDIASAARRAKGNYTRAYWEHFWTTKSRFIQPRSAYCYTAHTFQGSQAATVLMDTQDILANSRKSEAFRCWYVAASRSTNLLISR